MRLILERLPYTLTFLTTLISDFAMLKKPAAAEEPSTTTTGIMLDPPEVEGDGEQRRLGFCRFNFCGKSTIVIRKEPTILLGIQRVKRLFQFATASVNGGRLFGQLRTQRIEPFRDRGMVE
jgi:hypothetical protein